ncbi:MAG TPA: hypothetical protein VGM10_25530 [Actinocrinis sp.]
MTPELWEQGSDRSSDPRDELVQALLGLRWALPRTDADARTALDQLSAVASRLGRLGAEAAQAAAAAGGGEGEAQAPWQAQVQGLLAQAGFALDWWRPVLDDIDLDWTLNHQAHLSADLARIASAGARILDQYAPPRHAFGTAAAAQGAAAAAQPSGAQSPSVEAAQAYEAAQSPQAPPKRSQAPRVAAAFGSVPAAAIVDPLASAGRHRRFAEDLGLPRPKQGSAKPAAGANALHNSGQGAGQGSTGQAWTEESRALQAIEAAQEYQRAREYRRLQERRVQAAQASQPAVTARPAPAAPAEPAPDAAPEPAVVWDFRGPAAEPEPEAPPAAEPALEPEPRPEQRSAPSVVEPEEQTERQRDPMPVPESEAAQAELAQSAPTTPVEPVDAAPAMPVPPLIPSVKSLFGAPLPSASVAVPAPVAPVEPEDEPEDAVQDEAPDDEDESEEEEPTEEPIAEFAPAEPESEPEAEPEPEQSEQPEPEAVGDPRPEQALAQDPVIDEPEQEAAEPVDPDGAESDSADSDGADLDGADSDRDEPDGVDPDTAVLSVAEPGAVAEPRDAEPDIAEPVAVEEPDDEPDDAEPPLGMTSLYNPVLGASALQDDHDHDASNRPEPDYSALDDPLFGELPVGRDEPAPAPDPLFGPSLEPEPQPAAQRENTEFGFDFLLPFGDYDDADDKREADIRTEPPPLPQPFLNRESEERLVEPEFGPLPMAAGEQLVRLRIPDQSVAPPPVRPTARPRVGTDDDGDDPDAPGGRSRMQRAGMAAQAVGVLGLVGVLAWWAVGHYDGHDTSDSGHPPAAAVTGSPTHGGAAPAASGGSHPASAAPSTPAATTLPPNAADVTALQLSLEGGSANEQDVTMIVSLDTTGSGPVTVLVDYYGVGSGSTARVAEMTATYTVSGPYQFSVAIPSSAYCGTVFTLTASSGSASSTQSTDPGC